MIARASAHRLPPREPIPPVAAALVIDVLRATSTLTTALRNGARAVIPAASPDEARALARARPGALLGGERAGRRIEGFDLGNSPFEYGPEAVAGRDLVFASTNGSLALIAARRARRRVLAAFVNASAAVEAVAGEPEVVVVCAGKEGTLGIEDAACAGWLLRALERRGWAVEGAAARALLRLAPAGEREVRAAVEGAAHGRDLRSLGPSYAADVDYCATLDRLDRAFAV